MNTEINENIENIQKAQNGYAGYIAKILRCLGVLALLGGAVAFLIDGWTAVDHIARYYKFLGVTTLLSLTGIFTAIKMRELKGARTLLALSLIAIPVNFCQLGGFLFSRFADQNSLAYLPEYLIWTAPNTFSALITTLVGFMVLSAIAWLAYSCLSKLERVVLTGACIALNSCLLIPTRDPNDIAIISLLMVVAAYLCNLKIKSQQQRFEVLEKFICRVSLWVPLAIITIRNAMFYGSTDALLGLMLLYAATIVFVFTTSFYGLNRKFGMLDSLGLVLMGSGLYIEVHQFVGMFAIPTAYQVYAFAATLLLSGYIAGEFLPAVKRNILICATCLTEALIVINLFSYHSSIHGLITIVFAIGGIMTSRQLKNVFTAYLSATTFLTGLVVLSTDLFNVLVGSWFLISLTGIALVLLASHIERDSSKYKRILESLLYIEKGMK